MGEFREIFEVYGADYNSTMARFMGKEAMYLKFLDCSLRMTTLRSWEQPLSSRTMRLHLLPPIRLRG